MNIKLPKIRGIKAIMSRINYPYKYLIDIFLKSS
jgi:hypothetical protein